MRKNKTITLFSISAICILLFVTMLILILSENADLNHIDKNILAAFANGRAEWLNWFFVILSYIGGTKAIALFILILLILPNRKKLGLPLAIVVATSALLNLTIKLIVSRARPDGFFLSSAPLGYAFPSTSSFPSGHAQTATVFFVTLAYLVCKNYVKTKPIKILLMTCAIIFSVLIAIARMYLGVHFPTDVLCGTLLATSLLCIAYLIDCSFDATHSMHKN